MIFVRIESTVLNLRFSEKKAARVWMLIFVCPRYLGIYSKHRKCSFSKYRVSIGMPSCSIFVFEKKAARVWMLIFVCPRYLGIYSKHRKCSFSKYRVSIGMPSCSIFVSYDAYTMALRGLYDVVLHS